MRLHDSAREAELNGAGDSDRGSNWEALLAAAQRGDADAYRRLLEAILPFARSVARRRLGDGDAVEDAVQDSLLTLHRVRHTYRPGSPVRPWLAAIVTRRAIDVARKRARTGGREVHDPGAYETFAAPGANREEGSDPAALARMLGELTPKQKEAIELVKLKEMTMAEASTESGQSVASLKVNVHRGLIRLRQRFGGGGE